MTDTKATMTGRGLRFEDGRKVDLFDLGATFQAHFTQRDGVETRLALSYEAMAALVRLYIEAHEADCAFIQDGMIEFGRMRA